ncbi:MAG: hypothetical protein PCFJNLEI_01815 [Verrucomicrobiae bacterium]|nr:hypothetical protein [Verrucomicrobiae bacterium]
MFLKLCLAVICAGALTAEAGGVRVIRVTTTDDLAISATYYPVEMPAAPAVLLVHALGKNRDEWAAIAPVLQRNGIAALALDLRGHGDSTRRLTADGPQLVDYRSFRAKDYHDMLLDINAAFEWLSEQPGIATEQIGVVGAKLGANLALRYAAINEDIAAILIFSPTLNSQDIRTDKIITKIGKRPLRIAVASGDANSFLAAKQLLKLRKDAGQAVTESEITVSTGTLQGTELITGVAGLSEAVFSWLQRALAGEPAIPAP